MRSGSPQQRISRKIAKHTKKGKPKPKSFTPSRKARKGNLKRQPLFRPLADASRINF